MILSGDGRRTRYLEKIWPGGRQTYGKLVHSCICEDFSQVVLCTRARALVPTLCVTQPRQLILNYFPPNCALFRRPPHFYSLREGGFRACKRHWCYIRTSGTLLSYSTLPYGAPTARTILTHVCVRRGGLNRKELLA